jgi:hypothetical protein
MKTQKTHKKTRTPKNPAPQELTEQQLEQVAGGAVDAFFKLNSGPQTTQKYIEYKLTDVVVTS